MDSFCQSFCDIGKEGESDEATKGSAADEGRTPANSESGETTKNKLALIARKMDLVKGKKEDLSILTLQELEIQV